MLQRLEKEGLVERIPKAPGHPLTEVKLTPKGEEACSTRVEILKDAIADVMSVLSEEQLVELLEVTRILQLRAVDMLQMRLKPSPGSPEEVTLPARPQ
jgi:DNA-binding MarR family transcriptional regulator